jgi:hypothetical protein
MLWGQILNIDKARRPSLCLTYENGSDMLIRISRTLRKKSEEGLASFDEPGAAIAFVII